MPVATSAGDYHEDELQFVLNQRGLGSSTEPAGALKQTEGTQIPGNSEKVKTGYPGFFNKLIYGDNPALPTFELGEHKDQTTEEGVDQAINIAMSFGTGTMAGVKSATIGAKLSDLGHAQVLEANAVHPDEIWSKTGFGRGAEGRWKYEINDSTAKFDPKWTEGEKTFNAVSGRDIANLEDILDHPGLYQAYPHLKNVNVIHDPNYPSKGAEWNNSNTITMGTEAAKNQGTLMHEVQHAIQDFEGFAKGGSPRSDAGYLKYTPDMKALMPEMREMIRKADDPSYTFTAKDTERKEYLTKLATKYKEYTEAAYNQAHEFYERLAGETESRNVDVRLLLTEAERRKFPPTWTEDPSRSKQIVRDRPTTTTAYGIVEGGKYVKPASDKPIDFRRAANENLPEGHPDRPYNIREPSMIGSKEADDAMDAAWKAMVDKSKRLDKVIAEMEKMNKRSPDTFSEIEQARWNKLRNEHDKLTSTILD